MLLAIFTLALATSASPDPADLEPPPLIDSMPTPAPVIAETPRDASVVESEDDDSRDVVIGSSALGGAIGFGTTALTGVVLGTIGTVLTSGFFFPAAVVLTIVALPVGSGVGATLGHALTSSEGAIGAGVSGALGTVGGAIAGGGLGLGLGVAGAYTVFSSDGITAALFAIGTTSVGAIAGGLAGSAVGPALHALSE